MRQVRLHNTIKATSCQYWRAYARMGYMEIALLPKDSLRIKGKRASFAVDPPSSEGKQDKNPYSAAIVLTRSIDQLQIQHDAVVINGPGEYEIGGIKMNSSSSEEDIIYNPNVDGVDILLGKLTSIEKMQHKLKEQHIILVYVDSISNVSFVNSLASNVVIFYGELASKLVESLGKGNVATMSKYSVTLDKLPQEVVTVILE